MFEQWCECGGGGALYCGGTIPIDEGITIYVESFHGFATTEPWCATNEKKN